MKLYNFVAVMIALVLSTSVNAALLGRDLDGNLATTEAYYDDVVNLTWLADANLSGLMNWSDANTLAANLDIAGVTGWRLPSTLQPDASCSDQAVVSSGFNCTGSEMGNLFYNVLGGSAGSSITTFNNANYDLFSNIQSDGYWSSMEYAPNIINAWGFGFDFGDLDYDPKSEDSYAWVVHSGIVGTSVIPVPAAVYLFSSGLLGLIGFVRKA